MFVGWDPSLLVQRGCLAERSSPLKISWTTYKRKYITNVFEKLGQNYGIRISKQIDKSFKKFVYTFACDKFNYFICKYQYIQAQLSVG